MSKLGIGGLVLIFAVLVGVSMRPDDGTPYSARPLDAASSVSGTIHAKPLPKAPTVIDLAQAFAAVVVALVVAVTASGWVGQVRRRSSGQHGPSLVWRSPRTRRGPPVLV